MMNNTQQEQSRGVALIIALVILVVFSTLLLAMLTDVKTEVQMSGIERNSERALKLAEAGVHIARATFLQDELYMNVTTTRPLVSVDGFMNGGYFVTSLGSGLPGSEKWLEWHYDSSVSGHNPQSEITEYLKRVWATGPLGQNGAWPGTDATRFNLDNLYGIVAGGLYYPIEKGNTTVIRAHDEYSGMEKIKSNEQIRSYGKTNNEYVLWEGDKNVHDSTYNAGYARLLSPMASFVNLSTIPQREKPVITQHTIYFTYIGGGPATGTDTSSTVRLRAVNTLCNPNTKTDIETLWEFDTGIHGMGTAPAIFDPSPGAPGDEIIYFAVIQTEGVEIVREDLTAFPAMDTAARMESGTQDEQLYIYALVDTTGAVSACSTSGSYRLKWTTRFPDPAVAEWTDYPVEQATGTIGDHPPYVRMPSDMTPFLPEDDVLFDYRDGKSNIGADDDQFNQVRGDFYMYFFPQSVSPPLLQVTYRLNDGTISPELADAVTSGNPADPLIDIYLMFAAHSRVKITTDADPPRHTYDNGNNGSSTINQDWDRVTNNKKQSVVQTRLIALRDRLAGSYNSTSSAYSWNWKSARSRFPIFKWSCRVPGWDPKLDDERPWNGYGEFTWETWFEQQIAPMIKTVAVDQDGTKWVNPDTGDWYNLTDGTGRVTTGGARNRYTVLYTSVESGPIIDRQGLNGDYVTAPSTEKGAPVTFVDDWDKARLIVSAIRDTWDDYMEGRQTNPLYNDMLDAANSYAMPVKSNPFEPYWTFKYPVDDSSDDRVCNADGSDPFQYYPDSTETLITYPQFEADADLYRVGFPRSYTWSEARFDSTVSGTGAAHAVRNLKSQGWTNYSHTSETSRDVDVEGETSALCHDCLNGEGLIVQVFNHDITGGLEDLRVHGINARSGRHVWDYHMPARFVGDYYNATPAIANGRVFVGYQLPNRRSSVLQVLDADSGQELGSRITVDADSDAFIMSPSVANGALYVATNDFNGTPDSSSSGSSIDQSDDRIRIFALSPVLRLVSTGIYPADEETLLKMRSEEVGEFENMPRAERKLQVWFTGVGSKWEEIREIQKPN